MVDSNGFIHTSCVSKWYTRDGSRVPHLLNEIKGKIGSLTGDKGYDQRSVYRTVQKRNKDAAMVIHPRVNGVLSKSKECTQRDRHVQKIIDDGIYIWRRESGYYRQNKVENTFFRYKTTIGTKLRARTEESREVQATIGCKILNRFLDLGTAIS